jgi:hypothetical protein
MVVHACNPSIQEVEAGRSRELKANQGYVRIPFHQKEKEKALIPWGDYEVLMR